MRRPEHASRVAFGFADALGGAIAAAASYATRFEAGWIPIEGRIDVLPSRYLAALPVTIVVLIAASAATGAYGVAGLRRPTSLGQATRSALLGGALLATLALGTRDAFQYSRLAVLFTAIAYAPASLLTRRAALALLTHMAKRGSLGVRTAVAGDPVRVRALCEALRSEPWPATRIEYVLAAEHTVADGPRGAAIVASTEHLLALIRDGTVQEVIVAGNSADPGWSRALLSRLESTPVNVRLVPDLADDLLVNPDAVVIGGLPILALRERPLFGAHALAKRIVDVTVSLLLAAALSPVVAAIAIVIRATSRGPVLYRQQRTGLDGREFAILKFRTMVEDAERGSGPVMTQPRDTRVTPVGRVLRRLSLDELPQLWNVARGEMSLVGPRPERPEFLAAFREQHPGYMLRLSVKAGMTGLAQINGMRGDTPIADRLRLDLQYIDDWSLWLDLEILARTVVHVIRGQNAY